MADSPAHQHRLCRTRLLRWSVRASFLVIAVLAVCVALKVSSVRRERAAVAQLKEMHVYFTTIIPTRRCLPINLRGKAHSSSASHFPDCGKHSHMRHNGCETSSETTTFNR